MNPILFAIPVFILTIMIEAGVARRRGLRAYDLADAITSLQMGVLSQVTGVFWKLLSLGIYTIVYSRAAQLNWSAKSVGAWVLALILYDLCYYWNHRLSHEIGVLWASHVVHHSSEYYNLTTALRQTSTGALFGWIFYVPLAVLGIPPVMFVAVGLIDLLYQYWVHTELVGKLGWFDRVFVSPSNHRVHHGQNDYCIDRNYGGILIVWDRLFGSFVEERDDEPITYGIRKPLHSYNPVWGNLHHYADMWNQMIRARGWRAKVGAWMAPPGGWREGPVEPFELRGFARYASTASGTAKAVALVGYILLNAAFVAFLLFQWKLGFAVSALYAVAIVMLAFLIGWVLDHPSRNTSL